MSKTQITPELQLARWNRNMLLAAEETPSRLNGYVQLNLAQLNTRPKVLSSVPRSMSLVDKSLADVLKNLCCGKAPWPLFLFGENGRGKTLAALSLCDFVASPFYTQVEWLMEKVMASEVDVWQRVREADLAVLDELGCRMKVTDLEYNSIKRFCDEREMYGKRVAIYISNVSPGDLQGIYDDRIASRVLCGTVVKLAGEHRRMA